MAGRVSLPPAPPLPPGVKPSYPVEVDWSHPLTEGLRFCLSPDGRPLDIVNNDVLTVNGSVLYEQGGWKFGGSTSDYIEVPNKASNFDRENPTTFTVVVVMRPSGTTVQYSSPIARGDTGAGEWMVRHFNATAGNDFPHIWSAYADAGDYNASFSVANFNEYDYVVFAAVFGYNNGAGVRAIQYVDNEFSSFASDTTGSMTVTASKAITIGGADQNASRAEEGTVYTVYGFNRVLTEVELKELMRDPYAFLKPAVPMTQIITPASTPDDRVWIV